MFKHAVKQIEKSKLNTKPFPYFSVNNLLPAENLKNLNKALPGLKEVIGDDILFQSTSQTKKTMLPNSAIYKKLKKNKNFKNINLLFKKLKPIVLKKFDQSIKKYLKKNYQKSKLSYHSTFNVMRKGYIKSAHIDRRDHLVHVLFYPSSDSTKGGKIRIMKMKKHKKTYDVFPSKKDLSLASSHSVKNNFCLFTLNVPWSYHEVSKYYGKKDRKYFYAVYDFPIEEVGSKIKNRKKGFNKNPFWTSKVSVKSQNRKKTFFSE